MDYRVGKETRGVFVSYVPPPRLARASFHRTCSAYSTLSATDRSQKPSAARFAGCATRLSTTVVALGSRRVSAATTSLLVDAPSLLRNSLHSSPFPSRTHIRALTIAFRTMHDASSTTDGHVAGTSEVLSDARSQSPGSSKPNVVAAAEQAYASYKKTWNVDQLKTAITLLQQAVNNAPEPDAYLLGELGHCLDLYYEARGNLDDLQRAIAAKQSALQLVPDGHPDRALHLHNLSVSLQRRVESLGSSDDLASAIEMQLRAVDLTPDDDPYLPARLDDLGHLQDLRFRRFGELEDLESAILNSQRANELTPDDHPDKATGLHNLAQSLRGRFERLDDPADLERAITTQRRAVKLAPNGHPDLSIHLDNLGSLQWLRFRRFGELEDVESAISNEERANELTRDDHPDKAKRLHNLAWSLRSRFERLDDLADLERAIKTQYRAIELTPNDHPDLANRLGDLGSLQWLRFERFGELEDIESAISNEQRANELTPDDHPNKATWLHNLASSLRSRFERLDDPADLEQAITMQRRVVELTPSDHPELPNRLDGLGYLRLLRFRHFGDLKDIEGAISERKQAVKLAVDGHPLKATLLRNLAVSLDEYFRQDRTMEHFTEALSCYTEAASQPLDSPNSRLVTAKYVVIFLDNNPGFSTAEMLLLAHSRVLDVLTEVVWLGYSMQRRLEESRKLGQLVSSAVCAAVRVDALVKAVEWMDAGRTVIWTQTMSLHSPLHELQQILPDLARSLEDVHKQLQRSTHFLSHKHGVRVHESHGDSEADHHRGLAIKYGRLIAEIRHHPGLERFMRPPKLSTLLPICAYLRGPVVFLNIDRSRCDALVLLPDRTIRPVPLPNLSLDKAERIRTQWVAYLQQRDVRQRMATCVNRSSDGTGAAIRILGCLWRWIVQPILSALEILDLPKEGRLPHITWCPSGPLTQLPIHAAGIYDEEFGPHAYDFVVSSYTLSLSTLTRSISALAQQHASSPSGIIVVTQPETPGLRSLPGTTLEGERLRNVFANRPEVVSVLDGKAATTVTVKEALSQRPWLHLACHGSQDITDPLKSAFALQDGPLSLLDLMNTTADDAELAFLSACQTAVGDEKIPEESMHLAAGMLAVGFKGVIATMWSIRDDDAPLVVEAYYTKLLELRASGTLDASETGAAYALHEAAKMLREKIGEKNVLRWAPFVHFGV
ncbi:unnamed protein product [Peniophora sp. CBMAI 1063]|nr:unnamed protein product [Peniophora sp. CBMAI 1063]